MTKGAVPADNTLTLVLDQGGHASRAVVFDADGQRVAHAERAIETFHPAVNRVEHYGEAVVCSLVEAIRVVLDSLGGRASWVRAAGLATQRSSVIAFDGVTGAALSPVLSWQDTRARDTVIALAPEAERIRAITGLPLSPHYGASKLRWLADQPAAQRAAARGRLVLAPLASFLMHRLSRTRPVVADPANAARTQLFDLVTRDWSDELVQRFGLARDWLPQCVHTHGHTDDGFGELDIPGTAIPLHVMTGDQSAAIFAAGVPSPDTAYLNIGTGAFLQRAGKQAMPDVPGLLRSLVYADAQQTRFTLEATVNGASSALAWFARESGLGDLEARLPTWLDTVTNLPLFLNGIGGLAAPWWQPDFVSRFEGEAGLDATCPDVPAARAVAIAESIVFLVAINLERMTTVLDVPAMIQVSGGLAGLDGLMQRLASLTGVPVWRSSEAEATARGVAVLLGARPASSGETALFEPHRDEALAHRYARWREAMPSLAVSLLR